MTSSSTAAASSPSAAESMGCLLLSLLRLHVDSFSLSTGNDKKRSTVVCSCLYQNYMVLHKGLAWTDAHECAGLTNHNSVLCFKRGQTVYI